MSQHEYETDIDQERVDPALLAAAVELIRKHHVKLAAEEYGVEDTGFDLRTYLQLNENDKWMRPSTPTHTQMERNIPNVGIVPFFGRQKPYKFREYPKMMYAYNADTKVMETRTVVSKRAQEALCAAEEGWYDHPDKATQDCEQPVIETPRRRGRPRKLVEATA